MEYMAEEYYLFGCNKIIIRNVMIKVSKAINKYDVCTLKT